MCPFATISLWDQTLWCSIAIVQDLFGVSKVTCLLSFTIVDGSWSAWGSYGQCSKTCGRGIKIRHRYCTNPAPARGGRNCTGPRTDSAPCNERMCPGKLFSSLVHVQSQ